MLRPGKILKTNIHLRLSEPLKPGIYDVVVVYYARMLLQAEEDLRTNPVRIRIAESK